MTTFGTIGTILGAIVCAIIFVLLVMSAVSMALGVDPATWFDIEDSNDE